MAGATLLRRVKWIDLNGNLYEMAIWRVQRSQSNAEGVRYRLAFIRSGEPIPILLYDNHHPKGHHRHVKGQQEPYAFTTVAQLIADFMSEARGLSGDDK